MKLFNKKTKDSQADPVHTEVPAEVKAAKPRKSWWRFNKKSRQTNDPAAADDKAKKEKSARPGKGWRLFARKTGKADVEESAAAKSEKPGKAKKVKAAGPVSAPRRWRVVMVGIFLLLLFAMSGAGIGYAAGIQQRLGEENQQKLVAAATHYNYGVQAMLQSNYEVARLQFEYVLKIVPNFPGLQEKYTQTMMEIVKNSQPTATPQPTPTADMRGVETLFAQAQQLVNSKNGTAALVTLDTLRNQDLHYRTLDVDALYYLALRFSGADKILRQADQEGGLYDLTLASRFAPLDHEAVQYATWARNYITAISYWNVNWEKVVFYLNQVFSASPGLQDSKGNSVRSRTIEALWRYGDVLADSNNFCDAAKYYKYSLAIQQFDSVQAKYNSANLRCLGPSLTQQALPTAGPLVVETPTAGVIADTPTP
jgi:hypothetical protein